MLAENAYALLGVSPFASDKQVRRAFLQLARSLHPDMNSDPSAVEDFKTVTAAYDVIQEERRFRATYGTQPEAPQATGATAGAAQAQRARRNAERAAADEPSRSQGEPSTGSDAQAAAANGAAEEAKRAAAERAAREAESPVEGRADLEDADAVPDMRRAARHRGARHADPDPDEELARRTAEAAAARQREEADLAELRRLAEEARQAAVQEARAQREVDERRAARAREEARRATAASEPPRDAAAGARIRVATDWHGWENEPKTARDVDDKTDASAAAGAPDDADVAVSRVRVNTAALYGRTNATGPAPVVDGAATPATPTRSFDDTLFTPDGDDLVGQIDLPLADAVLGTEVDVPAPGGTRRLRVPAGTGTDDVLTVPGAGLPKTDGGAGDLRLVARVLTPKRLTDPERRMFEWMGEHRGADEQAEVVPPTR